MSSDLVRLLALLVGVTLAPAAADASLGIVETSVLEECEAESGDRIDGDDAQPPTAAAARTAPGAVTLDPSVDDRRVCAGFFSNRIARAPPR